jgi:rhamnulokinase
MPEIVQPGAILGRLRAELADELGIGALTVIAPATHDTASAVAGTPLEPGWAYISSGTWSLVGVECDEAVMSEEAARANFTNEGGVAGTVRFLKNVMGLWLLERCRSEWTSAGFAMDVETLIDSVRHVGGFAGFVYPDAARFFNPPSMTGELRAALAETGQPAPDDPVVMTKVILDSLALRYASVIDTIEALTGHPVRGLHIVGGGSQNRYLNQATADATARPVLAGPVEATAAGNLLVQAITSGEVASLADGRRLLSRLAPPERFVARNAAAWAEARKRYLEIENTAIAREGAG